MQPLEATADIEQSSREDEEVVRVLDAYLADVESGRPANAELLLARHPTIAHRLRPCLAGLQLLGGGISKPGPATTVLGDYLIVREIGRGGMGVVYEAIQRDDGGHVALKVLPFAAALDPRQLQRFKNEAHAASQLRHPHIVPVYDVGCAGGTHFYTMQLIEGESLAALWRRKRSEARERIGSEAAEEGADTRTIASAASRDQGDGLASLRWNSRAYIRRIVELIRQAAEALDHAHHLGIVHRDIKPSNLLVDRRGQVWVADFGLASVQGGEGLTATGDLLGTFRYMSPEQASARRGVVDHRSDIYSLGVTLYEMLTLRTAFAGHDREEILAQLSFGEPRLPSRLNPSVSRDLETIVLTAIAKSPSDRYATASALAEDLGRFLADKPVQARRPGVQVRIRRWVGRHRLWVAAIGLLLLVATIGLSICTAVVWRALVAEEFQRKLATDRQLQSRRHLYAAQMNLALDDWERGNVARVLDLLERQRPATGQEDLRGFEWYHLQRRCQSALQAELVGHKGAVRAIASSADGRIWATAGEDGAIQLWNALNQELVRRFELAGDAIHGVAISPDGRFLAAAGTHGVRVWDLEGCTLLAQLTNSPGFSSDVAFSGDSKTLVTNNGIVWDVESRQQKTALHLPGQVANSIAIMSDGSTVVGGGNDGQVLVWDLRTPGAPPAELGRHRTYIHCVALSPDEQTLLTGSEDGVVKLWDMATWCEKYSLRRHTGAVAAAAFSRSTPHIATASWDGSVKIWEMNKDDVILQQGHSSQVYAVTFAADGRRLLSGDENGRVRIWDLSASVEPMVFSGHTGLIRGLALSQDGQRIASGSADATVRMWDLSGQRQPAVIDNSLAENPAWHKALPQPVGGVKPNAMMGTSFIGRESIVAADFGGRVRRLGGDPFSTATEFEEAGGPVWSVAASPDGKTVAGAGYRSNDVIVWDAVLGRIRNRLKGHTDRVWSIAFSPDGHVLASGANDKSVRIWDAGSGSLRRKIELPCEWIYAIAISTDSQFLAASGDDNRIRLFRISTGDELEPIGQHSATIRALSFLPDGKTLASGGNDGVVKLWDVATRQQRLALQAVRPTRDAVQSGAWTKAETENPSIWSIAVSADGQALAAGDSIGRIIVWRAAPAE